MTKQADILNDPKYIAVLDHGFLGLVDYMGSDAAIVQAARVSYGAGTKTVREDRGLIRYLVSHKHTSPIEQCQVKLHIKAPIFVLRQWNRHRTASLNEESARYSVLDDDFYLPEMDVIKPQSSDNKQGRAGEMSAENATGVRWMIEQTNRQAYDAYRALLGDREPNAQGEVAYDVFSEDDPVFGKDFDGVAREMARTILPVGIYSELYWSQNLHNLLHLIKLRADPHAQYEIRVFAQAVYDLIQPLFPATVEAFDDYIRDATTNSRMEVNVLVSLLTSNVPARQAYADALAEAGGEKAYAEANGLNLRELRDFVSRWKLVADDAA
jgi:thymidylate synthase (FAD)